METKSELSDYEEKAISDFCYFFYSGKWTEAGLVSLWKLIGEDFLALVKVSEYAKKTNRTPQGVRRFQRNKIIDFAGVQLISNKENT